MFRKAWDVFLAVMICYTASNSLAKLLAIEISLCMANISADNLHAVTSIASEETESTFCLRRASVNDGDVVICDDDAVLVFLLWTLRYGALFYYLHKAAVCVDVHNGMTVKAAGMNKAAG